MKQDVSPCAAQSAGSEQEGQTHCPGMFGQHSLQEQSPAAAPDLAPINSWCACFAELGVIGMCLGKWGVKL